MPAGLYPGGPILPGPSPPVQLGTPVSFHVPGSDLSGGVRNSFGQFCAPAPMSELATPGQVGEFVTNVQIGEQEDLGVPGLSVPHESGPAAFVGDMDGSDMPESSACETEVKGASRRRRLRKRRRH